MIYTALSLATTGLNQPASLTDPAYPQMVAVSALQWDGNGVCGSYFGYVRPENAVISAAAEKAHGITNRLAQSRGLPERFALSWITNTLRASSHVIGWQLASDVDVIRSALIRHGNCPVCRATRIRLENTCSFSQSFPVKVGIPLTKYEIQ